MEANSILLEMLYARVIILFSKKTGKSLDDSLDIFYNSKIYELLKNDNGDYYCRGEQYISDDLVNEYKNK
ncbi:hypothetical protein [Clostridium sp.]|uniref:hypothetical protein n=1 Tax=Clostridium sp. TaxID=1506 RepID=UPI00321746C9